MLIPLIVCSVVIGLFHIIFYHKYNWPSYVKKINKIPGPKGVFYFGYALKAMYTRGEDLIELFNGDVEKHGPIVRYWFSGIGAIFLTNPDDAKIVLGIRSDIKKALFYKYLKPWLGDSLLSSTGEKWRKMRKILTPTFHFSVLRGFLDIFSKNADIMLRLLENSPEKNNINLHKYLCYCALDNICETSMGTCMNAQRDGSGNEFVRALIRIQEILFERALSVIYFTDHNFWLSSKGREHDRLVKLVNGVTNKIIEEKKKLRAMNLQRKGDGFHPSRQDEQTIDGFCEENLYKKKCSFIDLLLDQQDSEDLTDENIRDEVNVFIFAGHDTTAATMNWAFFELGHHPHIQDNVYQELQQLFGDSDRAPTYEDLMNMKYLKQVILETLRLHPVVPFFGRKFDSDIQLKNHLIPAGTDVWIITYYIHRDPNTYPDPDKFDPDRFLPEEVEKRHLYSYLPFSVGQRNCIGQKYGMLQMLAVMSSVLRKFNLESLVSRESVKAVPSIILKPHVDLGFKIIPRR